MPNLSVVFFGFFFTFFMTSLGAGVVFFIKRGSGKNFYLIFNGFAAGIMIASAIWSLILPSISLSNEIFDFSILPPLIGFLLGAFFVVFLDFDVCKNKKTKTIKPSKKFFHKNIKLFVAITVHNIPEGLAVGFAFGSANNMSGQGAILSAIGLAIGIGLQNLPEGAAVSLPFFAKTKNKFKSFLFGMTSGAVEPVFACLGFVLASKISQIQPWLLSFAAGMMFFEVVDELIPETKKTPNSHIGSISFIVGFVLMMFLDVVFT